MGVSTYEIDIYHSDLNFTIRHLMVNRVRGWFTHWLGVVLLDELDVTRSSVEVAIDATSVATGFPLRDAELRSPMFLDTVRHPELSFRSTRVDASGDGRIDVTGDLRIRGMTHEVRVDTEIGHHVVDAFGTERVAYSGRAAFGCADFSIQVGLEVEAIKRTAPRLVRAGSLGLQVL